MARARAKANARATASTRASTASNRRQVSEARQVEQLPLFVELKPKAKRRKKPGPKPSRLSGSRHEKRPELKGRFPVHVVLRAHKDMGSLRKRFMYRGLRAATIAVAMRELNEKENGAFRIVHISIQRTHVHLLVEADHQKALSRGMQSFEISAAKHLNRALSVSLRLPRRRRGSVFPDRFHQEIITTPTQTRHALSYVLNNWRKHREDRGGVQRTWNVDPFSTGALFAGWKALENAVLMWPLPPTYEPLVVYLPKTWLLTTGWMIHGRIGFDEVPSEKQAVRAGGSRAAP
jgi:putative transposase